MYRGVVRAPYYPLNMPGRQFHNMNIQVYWATAIPYLSHPYPLYHTYLIHIPGPSLGLVYAIMACLQDVVLTVPQYPSVLEDPSTVPFKECSVCWVVNPQLSFTSHLRLPDRLLPKAGCSTYGEDFIQALVFYSTFKQLELPGSGPMERRACLHLHFS